MTRYSIALLVGPLFTGVVHSTLSTLFRQPTNDISCGREIQLTHYIEPSLSFNTLFQTEPLSKLRAKLRLPALLARCNPPQAC